MLNVKTAEPQSLLAIDINGKITKEDIEKFEEFYEQIKAPHKKLNLLMTIKGMDYSLGGFIQDIKFDITHWRDFKKIAVVSDSKTAEVSTQLTTLLPWLDIKYFTLEQEDSALKWVES